MERADERGSVGVVRTRSLDLPLPDGGLTLECGRTLPALTVAYEACGTLSPHKDNVILICHALSGDAHVAGRLDTPDGPVGWWDQMVGPGKGIDTDLYYVVCPNVLGGCKGTTGPASIDPKTGRPYGASFPPVSVADIVDVHRLLLQELGIERLAGIVGGSFGGMQVLDWVIRYPDTVDRAVCVASSARLSTQALSFDIVGRRAIMGDPDWQEGDYHATGRVPAVGLSLARQIGHITYLSSGMMASKFGRDRRGTGAADGDGPPAGVVQEFQVESYLEHQGRKFVGRFDANSYLHLTRAMDEFDLVERYGSLEAAVAPIRSKLLMVALSEDWLFPPNQSMALATALLRSGKNVSYCLLHAPHGHDAFLVDIEHLTDAMRAFLPWVSHADGRPPPARPALPASRRAHGVMVEMIGERSRVLDLGCGGGEFLTLLADRRSAQGMGVDIDVQHVIQVIDHGHDVFQADIDAGLAMIPDRAYDYAVLSETLQVVRRPRFVLHEMLRVAREGIVTFPNIGKWSHRLRLGLRGRMPKGGSLPYEWYDTPNIHLFTLKDFLEVCRRDGIRVLDVVCLSDSLLGRLLIRSGRCNLGASRVLVRITARDRSVDGPDARGPVCRGTAKKAESTWK